MLRTDYIFDASAKTITFTNAVVEAYLEVIINSVDGIIIYNSISPSTTGTLVDKVLTLLYDTAAMSDADDLQIFYGETARATSGHTFAELITRTSTLVDDSDIDDSLGDFINQGVSEIAGGMQSVFSDMITPPLPDLFSIDTVTTDTALAYVNMPDTFQRSLQLAVSARGSEIDIAHSFIDFITTYPALSRVGNISEVVEHGGKIYYQGIPLVGEILTLHFYRKPVIMISDADVPDGIPEHLQIALLTNFAAWKAYEILEDGIEGETPNTIKFKGLFFDALQTLELAIPYDSRGLILR